MATVKTKLEIKNWDERPFREAPDGTKFATADVTLASTEGAFTGEGALESMLHYRADGTSTFVSLLKLAGRFDGREGELLLSGDGAYDGTTARVSATIVEAGGDLTGARGSAESVSTHADYPYMPLTLTFDI